ncbi:MULTISPECIES: Asp-tRNA(Asn)/Glu-tRNA(Gln) amidotransferase subunit GatA [Helicobacter]|uniref:Glutamyl-tRNA(Gln) amidotransferase subunit A n=3 Tax=Helicobacter typhlonius TaxID=76936 RepID=A0A099UGI4_9HELI|nr:MULTISPECIES: Asp-tRNA(Asn)/Glu-tRNA(Gln) amidotransferase subunit GatA [Helicobacter]TLD78789.1 Asp-tRNA(Asn)/Glu-tRNA(Gln) amidotransferase subunit GatA [Helicobacter typhlonius]TLD90124.1 Asp-tRNA(Asn)/Glu-tRNA(Gln) amidotransferase subunit GatA [Helicobacter sp. MIT 03-1616]CUU40780.1 Aspartyl-tRNA(Asn) amidotransferase subunit A @ Glutamyl-tRNA(Gln) amidotransferase subunit A [Helicobacter typhlonius]
MITLKNALTKSEGELKEIKQDLIKKIKDNIELNAYIGNVQESGSGVPILIKDNINVKGWEITCASRILKGYISPYDAQVITKIHQNKMCAFGRANMDEFAMGSTSESSCYGRVKNPFDTSRVPGGSSGGSAAAVAAGIAIASLGSDTGGSIRQPAGFCGCVGLKPSYGRVSRYGLVAYSSSLDQIGPITQNVEDAALLIDAISGYDERDSTSVKLPTLSTFMNLDSNKRYKIAVLKDFLKDATQEVQEAYEKTIKILESMGHTIIEKSMLDTRYHISTYYIICTAEASSNLARFDGVRYGTRAQSENLKDMYYNTRSAYFGEEVKRRILLGSFVLSSGYYDAYYLKAQQVRKKICAEYEEIFNECDVILLPIAPSVAPKFGATHSPLEMYLSDIYTIGVNLAGLPAICMPVDKDSNGLSIGMQLIGAKFAEQTILNAAYGLEKELA